MKKYGDIKAYNSPLAVKLRELLKCSPKAKERTTYKTLAEHLNVKQQSVSSWANGTTIPDTKHIKPIAEFFGVTCDYLLDLPHIKVPDDLILEVERRYGLGESVQGRLEILCKDSKTKRIINFMLCSADLCDFLSKLHEYGHADDDFYIMEKTVMKTISNYENDINKNIASDIDKRDYRENLKLLERVRNQEKIAEIIRNEHFGDMTKTLRNICNEWLSAVRDERKREQNG